jgi:hypothetical protein
VRLWKTGFRARLFCRERAARGGAQKAASPKSPFHSVCPVQRASPSAREETLSANAFGYIVGALRVPAASAPQPVDQTAAHKSGDWAIQFATQKSEAQAKVNVARLNAKYAATLNGAKIGVNKTLADGESIYALRVTSLSKADAAALCERLKGRDCLIAQ